MSDVEKSEAENKETSPPVPQPPAPEQPDGSKTPLDNLKGMLAEVDNGPQVSKESEASEATPPVDSPQPVISEDVMISKEAIRKAAEKVQGASGDNLSPKQVDDILRPLIEVVLAADVRKDLDSGFQTKKMNLLKEALGQFKAETPTPDAAGEGTSNP